jgi:drug/metabolite transporter (DMT)-like permease
VSVAGIALAVVAAVANAFAVVLQAAEDRRSPDRDAMRASLLVRLARRPRWLAGAALMALAGATQIMALAFAPIAVVQPMLSTSQLVLLATARVKLRERVGRSELLGATAIALGLIAVVYAAPHQSSVAVGAVRLAPPMLVVGGLALVTYVAGRARPALRLLLVVGAGLSYACADFVSKLLSNAGSSGAWWLVGVWVAVLLGVGGAAFLQETTALQHRPAVTVAPVIGAVKVPLPVLMALWAGMESWHGDDLRIALLLAGLALSAVGAATLGRSEAVSRVSAGGESDGASDASGQGHHLAGSSAQASGPRPVPSGP